MLLGLALGSFPRTCPLSLTNEGCRRDHNSSVMLGLRTPNVTEKWAPLVPLVVTTVNAFVLL